MKKIVAIVLCVALLAAVMAISASALEASNTNTSVSYISQSAGRHKPAVKDLRNPSPLSS